jgi:DNA helicase HerA-like ATPase
MASHVEGGRAAATAPVDYAEARRTVAERLTLRPTAYSVDGQTFSFEAPLAFEIPAGGFVRLRTAAGAEYLGQVLGKEVVNREGPELTVEGDAGLGLEQTPVRIAQTAFRVRLRHVEGTGILLGRLDGDGVASPASSDLFENADIDVAPAEAVSHYLEARGRGRATLAIGSLRAGDGRAGAGLYAAGFDRHTFLCGQSGSGKTFSLGVILERLLLETDLRIVIVDPNSDFVRLGELRPYEEVAPGFPGGLDPDAYAALRERYQSIAAGIRVLRPTPRGTRSANALRLRFSDLTEAVQGLVLQLDPLADREEYGAFWTIVKRQGRDKFSLADVRAAAAHDLSHDARRVSLRIANLGVADWDVWAEADEPSVADFGDDWRVLVFDVGGFGTQLEKSLIANGALGAFWHRRNERRPVLLVIDEAHNVCPQEPTDPLQASATERAVRIAGEGRKYGLYLLVSTQRPQKLHVNVLSQCDNLVLMRMNSVADLDRLAGVFSFVPPSLMARSSYFSQGEALLAGKIVPTPLLAKFEGRLTREGGGDVPTTWARSR